MADNTTPAGAALHVHWNDVKILDAAGANPEAVFQLLERHGQNEGVRPTPPAVYQWVSRRKIPDHWRARLVYALLAEQRIGPQHLFRVGNEAKKQVRKPKQ